MIANSEKHVKQGEFSFYGGVSVDFYSYFGKQYGDFSENWETLNLTEAFKVRN